MVTAQSGGTEKARIRLIGQATAATRMPRALWNAMQSMPGQDFEPSAFPSNYLLRKSLEEEAQLDVRYVDCCTNGCRAFTRSYSKDTYCHSCKQPRYHTNVSAHFIEKNRNEVFLMPLPCMLPLTSHRERLDRNLRISPRSIVYERSSRTALSASGYSTLRSVRWILKNIKTSGKASIYAH